ncbi:hypothetical protein [Calothrix sp. NIES-2098]|uniref:hypothetical protein n=1 Tax=Calothrix sp. NIES-2098 TaxID=1954171 RepID=UPI0030DAF6CE
MGAFAVRRSKLRSILANKQNGREFSCIYLCECLLSGDRRNRNDRHLVLQLPTRLDLNGEWCYDMGIDRAAAQLMQSHNCGTKL